MTTQSRIYPGDGDPRHGTANGYGNLGCRGPDCTAAWARYHYDLEAKPRPPLDPDDPRHGTSSGYRWWKCRCAECMGYNAEIARRAYARKMQRKRVGELRTKAG
jgi:hypothetical protein